MKFTLALHLFLAENRCLELSFMKRGFETIYCLMITNIGND